MKILIVTPYLASIYGGIAKVVPEIAGCIRLNSISVDLVTTNANGAKKLDVVLNDWLQQTPYRIQYFDCWHHNDTIISPSLSYWLIRHIKDYDLVHTHTIFSLQIPFAHWLCQWYKIPYIMTPHGMLEPWALSYKAWKKKYYYQLLEKPALQRASAIHVLTEAERNSIQQLGLNIPLVKIPNGIHRHEFDFLPDPELFYKQFPQTRNKTLILFLGRIDPKKGLDLLASAFSQVYPQFPHAHLIIAGPDSIGFLTTVKNYFEKAGCLGSVTFTGMLSGSLKYAALAAASLYIAPSYSEGFSMSVLEAMAVGLPCIITTGCNFPEAGTTRSAHIVNPNVDEIANALIQCLRNPLYAQEMGNHARDFILTKYTWDNIANRMIEIYTKIIS